MDGLFFYSEIYQRSNPRSISGSYFTSTLFAPIQDSM